MLNLIPHTLEDDLAKEHHIAIVRRASFIVCITVLFCSGVLYASNWWLAGQLASIGTLLYKPDQIATTNAVIEINERIATITNIQKKYTEWSALLGDVTQLVPEGVSITYLTVSATDDTFDIRGNAQTRDDLASFKALLEQADRVTSLTAPLSNFLEQTDIHFQFTGTLYTKPYQKGPH